MLDKIWDFVIRVIGVVIGISIAYLATYIYGHDSSAAFEVATILMLGGIGISLFCIFGGHDG